MNMATKLDATSEDHLCLFLLICQQMSTGNQVGFKIYYNNNNLNNNN